MPFTRNVLAAAAAVDPRTGQRRGSQGIPAGTPADGRYGHR
ncbi:hypothetical protein [Paenibacillus sp. FSL H7-0714]